MIDTLKKIQLQKLLALGALILLYAFFAIFGRDFVSMPSTLAILSRSYFVGFLAIGVTFVIITGGIDLSIGTVMMCAAVIGGLLFSRLGVPLWLCLVIMILIGTTFGTLNGLLVTKLKLPPFIATLGMMMVSTGLGSIITNVQTQTFPLPLGDGPNAWFARVFIRSGDIPMGVFFLAGYLIITLIVLKKTKLGRYTYAIGSNEEAVRLSGVHASNWKMIPYIISGFSAGLASIFFAAAYFVMTPGTGQGFELDAIAAVVIGGTSLSGGVGSVTGTVIGVFIMSVLAVGLVSLGLAPPWQVFLAGVVVIGAVFLDIQRTSRANQVKKEK
ncbi:MAG: ABC transporter permease [Oscillospiraceae bacterium]|nr:ABC transporter permease [Oscillospiraceae bacterium]